MTGATLPEHWLDAQRVQRQLAVLRLAAPQRRALLPAPRNAEIARLIGCAPNRVSEALVIAHRRGLAVVHSGQCRRVVEAADGSWRTAGPIPPPRANGATAPAVQLPAPAIPRIGPPDWATPVTLASPALRRGNQFAAAPAAVPTKRRMPSIRHSTCQWPLGGQLGWRPHPGL
ncbi:MAG: hypothetical protein ACOYOH_28950, partial [Paracraurococcus sp.]